MDRARDWGVRIQHEASLHDVSSFLTLTYSDEGLPDDYSVSVRALQLFVKRLRKAIEPTRVRYYACGEYGDDNWRPHYHLILFGFDFPDKIVWRKTSTGYYTYRSPLLESLWTVGHSEVGTVSRESGAYVARYCLKKVSGPGAPEHYRRLHPLTGEILTVEPEFALMSSRPGIGFGWFRRWESDAFPSGFVVVDGKKVPVPRYYKRKLAGRYDFASSDPDAVLVLDDLSETRRRGRKHARENAWNSTDERLAVRREVAELRQSKLKRDLGGK